MRVIFEILLLNIREMVDIVYFILKYILVYIKFIYILFQMESFGTFFVRDHLCASYILYIFFI